MTTRRHFLAGAGMGAAGLAVGALTGSLRDTDDDRETARASAAAERALADTVSAQRALTEASGAADRGLRVARLGTRRIVWNTTVTEPIAAITFDDGPTPEYTPRILEALATAGVTATFNVLGWNCVQHPQLLRDVVAAGHEIGNHTWDHRDLTALDPQGTRAALVRCKEEVEALIGRPLAGFRPPRGEITGYALRVAAELGYDTFIWSVTRGPGDARSVTSIADYLGQTVIGGDVVCLHDGIGRGTFGPHEPFALDLAARREFEVRALPSALGQIADRGLSLMSAGRLLARSQPDPPGGWTATPP